jgi:hypothetical protein
MQSDMTVGIHTTGRHQSTLGIDHLCAGRGFDIFRYLNDFAFIVNENAAAGNILACHGLDIAVFDQKHCYYLTLFLYSAMIAHKCPRRKVAFATNL